MKILILGGYGVFGGRLAELLADLPGLELLICGRDRQRAEVVAEGAVAALMTELRELDRRQCGDRLAAPRLRQLALQRRQRARAESGLQPRRPQPATGSGQA